MDSSLQILNIATEHLKDLPLCYHTIYCKPTVSASEHESCKLYSQRLGGHTQDIAQTYKPISRILDR